ncbi:hypothetical protein JQK19_03720 [Chromobacterium violaceum]|uniref:hypothetical protein n=1 Tax=Chromobacterium violaceum TaxID=536 RepID=UPI001BECAFE2|nr:hypothetical protein [Chromobacterium violaceum]MBT2866340.1 hypothetical protein [Chromobacterium violaceum]
MNPLTPLPADEISLSVNVPAPVEIVICVEGGMVCAVHASDPACIVTVLDWDDAEQDGSAYFPSRGFTSRAACLAHLRQLPLVG